MNPMEIGDDMQCAMEEIIEAYSSPYMTTPDDDSLTGAVSALALMEICRQLVEVNSHLGAIVKQLMKVKK